MRHLFVLSHRYLGLVMAFFLMIAGLTGSIMAFGDEIDAWLNPELFVTSSHGVALSPQQLAHRVEQADSRLQVTYVPIVHAEGKTVRLGVQALNDPQTGKPFVLGFTQLFADPVTGAVLGTRQTGTLKFDRVHFIPFIVKLHYTLFLPGKWGVWLFGGIALLWVMDCFIALYLTFPRGRPFLEKWQPAWKIKRKRFNFDLHRASGLWTWMVLLILAISSVSLNLYNEVFKPVVSWFSPLTPTPFETRIVLPAPVQPRFDYDQIIHRARTVGIERGIAQPVGAIGYRADRDFYLVIYRNTDGRTESGMPSSRLYFDASTGAVIGSRGLGDDSAGDLFSQLQFPLHSGRIAGLWGRAVIALIGLVVMVLSVTGLVIWWRKRRARQWHQGREVMSSVTSETTDMPVSGRQAVEAWQVRTG